MTAKVNRINPRKFNLENYSVEDISLIGETLQKSQFNPVTDYIEYFIYSTNICK